MVSCEHRPPPTDELTQFMFSLPTQNPRPIRTVSISRLLSNGVNMDITVAVTSRDGKWVFTHVLDEDGNEITLTATEKLLATCLIEAGVDETGR